ncbi:hypothetical protein A2U01_0107801, partial [Trifolium medium]|nr:hypothetical protein [Trifolium medium]
DLRPLATRISPQCNGRHCRYGNNFRTGNLTGHQ